MHTDTRFLRMDVGNAPFLVERLKVKVLPCVIGFRKGVGVDRVVGFEGVGDGGDGIETGDLEKRLVGSGVLVREKLRGHDFEAGAERRKGGGNGRTLRSEDEEDDDWD